MIIMISRNIQTGIGVLGITSEIYTYDSLGRLTNGTDNLNQITQVSYSQSRGKYYYFKEKFNYDKTGNRITKQITNAVKKKLTEEEILSGLYDDEVSIQENYTTNNLNQYINLDTLNNKGKDENISYKYDNNGNLKQDNEFKYFYDYKNRLIKVTRLNDEIVAEYSYDVLGRRIQKQTSDKIINYIYAGQNAIKEIITDETTQEVTTRENIYSNNLDDILLTIVINPDNTKTYQYYTKNHLNSIVAITDETGNILEEYIYDVFGKAYIRDGKSSNHREFKKSSLRVTRLYTGREYDNEINLYFLRARYYNPTTGRFISRDPIDISDDVNLYSYVGNNGVMFVDRKGLSKDLIMEKLVINFFDYALENTDGFFGIYDFYKGTGRNGIYDLKRNAFISAEVNFNGETVKFNGVDVDPSNLGNLLAGFNMGNTYVPSYFIEDYFHEVEIDNAMKQGYSIYSEIIADADEYTDVIWYDAGKNILDEYKKADTIEEKILILTNIIKETNPEYERRSKIETELRIYYTSLLNN